ncbi:18442_t:CDS:2 [Funneliformis geosporum]|uniref:18442_t:CDS:1 n=1 Tax=Funneliformis geosporum TaxID=1117311 RepID=A0A9W4SFL8_9GLOM|nr:18442_t:CDS:2 [Funneliformis geosporum]
MKTKNLLIWILIIVILLGGGVLIYKFSSSKSETLPADLPNPNGKLSQAELEKYLLEKRLDLQKYFVFNLGEEVKLKKYKIDSTFLSNIREVVPSLSTHLTRLIGEPKEFQKFVPETDYNELLLALFSETEAFSIEDYINKYSSEGKITEKDIENFKKIKEGQKKDIEKANNNFLKGIKEEKDKSSFYRWLIIFEELAQKLGMKNEKDIENAYMMKNKIN